MIEGIFACAAESLAFYDNFKRKQGLMDFEDQEIRVLELTRNNEAFRDSIKDRLNWTMVDEFQDTNPIQLSLFLALHALMAHSTWVGDPKQAIYGFRGTDPQLMDEATALIDYSRVLDCSWRSKELLVRFCNALYSRVFREMGEERVRLRIPTERTEEASGGDLEMWYLNAKNVRDETAALAVGIRDFLRENCVTPGDVAVLCRTNGQCRSVAEELEALSIRASVPQGALLAAPECQLAIAALRFMQGDDSLAEAEIACLSPLHRDHATWLTSVLTSAASEKAEWENDEDPKENSTEEDPTLAALFLAREKLKYQTPLEALKAAIDATDLSRVVKSWSNPRKRRANLDRLCGVCVQYMDQCGARRSAATVAGFVSYLRENAPEGAESFGNQTVQVLTWHRAKGLEWPVVILTSLDASRDASPFGVHVTPASKFDPKQPLDGRSIRFWPWPFGQQKKFPELDARRASTDEDRAVKEREAAESRRLLYVGMTRARDRMVFAVRRTGTDLKTAWIDSLSDNPDSPLIVWPTQGGRQEATVAGERFPVTVREFYPPESYEPACDFEEAQFLPPTPSAGTCQPNAWPSARIVPSALEVASDAASRVVVEEIANFGVRVPIRGKPDFGALGSALHSFFAADDDQFSLERRMKIVRRLLERWGVGGSVEPSDVLNAAEKLRSFLASRYPTACAFREWPITCRNEKHQRMQGWIDLLLELPKGYIIVDHKTTPNVAREHAKDYAPQLWAYREAVERATGKKVLATLLHMPVCGLVLEVSENFIL
jgi:ATP-dependent exoDNAse (exonuclease V) beta subunit